MSVSKQKIKTALQNAVNTIWKKDRDNLTVSNVRANVESNLDLDEGYLIDGEWKALSKTIIKTRVEELQAQEEEEPTSPEKPKPRSTAKPKAPVKPPPKKRASTTASRPPPQKKQKKQATPSVDGSDLSSDDSAESTQQPSDDESDSLSDESEEEKPKKNTKKTTTKPAPKKQAKKKVASDSEDVVDDDEHDMVDSAVESTNEDGVKEDVKKTSETMAADPTQPEDSDSEMSVLLDDEPKPKRATTSKSLDTKSQKKTTNSKVPKELTSQEIEIKTLQSQLKKCGITKIWQFELKQFGLDNKAKIKHLKQMLYDVGMDGRFSEMKAQDIKERRELMADVEAISENAESLGAPRARRSRAGRKVEATKTQRQSSGSGTEKEDAEEAVEDRAAAAKQDLAFLGSESESD